MAAIPKDPRQQPGRELPITPYPAVLARGVNAVARGEVVQHLDVAREGDASEQSFEQVVAEQVVLWHAPSQRGAERVDVVDALAVVAAFIEEILVHVRNGRGVRVETGVAGEYPSEK
jgi:hypothetical protein